MERQDPAPGIFSISDVLGADECRALIALAEAQGFTAAPCDRVVLEDVELAGRIWSRIEKHQPCIFADWQARGLNQRFRLYRGAPGQRFSWRGDGTHAVADGVSLLTLMIHLNDGYEGGQMQFESLSLSGTRGTALLFEHLNTPESAAVTSGLQYVLRSEVAYGPSVRETPEDALKALTRAWQYYENFYREDLRHEAMAAFVKRIAPEAIAENIHPRTRLAELFLQKPSRGGYVLLLCDERGSRFSIRWCGGHGDVMSEIVEVVGAIDHARWQRIVAWLDLRD